MVDVVSALDDFAIGRTVRLVSGGPEMAVELVVQNGPGVLPRYGVTCVWFSGAEVRHATFRPEVLRAVRVEADSKPEAAPTDADLLWCG